MSFPDNTEYRTPYVNGPAAPPVSPPVGYPPHYDDRPEYPPQYPPQFAPPAPPKKKSRTGLIAGLIGAGVALLCGIGIVAVALSGDPAKTPSAATTTGRLVAEQPPTTPAKTYPTPAAKDFELGVKVTKKQCFGSAGCNVEFEMTLAYNGPALEPNSSWDVTFDLQGSEDSYTSTLHMTLDGTGLHGTYDQDGGQMVQTKSSKTVLKPVVTSATAA